MPFKLSVMFWLSEDSYFVSKRCNVTKDNFLTDTRIWTLAQKKCNMKDKVVLCLNVEVR